MLAAAYREVGESRPPRSKVLRVTRLDGLMGVLAGYRNSRKSDLFGPKRAAPLSTSRPRTRCLLGDEISHALEGVLIKEKT